MSLIYLLVSYATEHFQIVWKEFIIYVAASFSDYSFIVRGKGIEYVKCRHDELIESQKLFVIAFQTWNEKATEASYG